MSLVTIRGQLGSGAPVVGRFEDHICLFPSLFAGVKFGKILSVLGLRQNRFLRGPRLSFLKLGTGLAPEPMRRILPHLVVDFVVDFC